MNKLILSIFLLSALASTPCIARVFSLPNGGSVSGGGGADYHVDSYAWFTTPDRTQNVNICIQASENFGLPSSQLRTLTEYAFNSWAKYYIDAHGLEKRSTEICPINGIRNGFRIATHAVVSEFCAGNEDLTIYFGVQNAEINRRKEKYLMPVGFAELINPKNSGKFQDAWSPGMIWIRPPESSSPRTASSQGSGGIYWNSYEGAALEALLLHEMGHVFGNGHIDYTVMRDNTGNDVINWVQKTQTKNPRSKFYDLYLNIDQQRYLVYTPDFDKEIELMPDLHYSLEDERFREEIAKAYKGAFELLTGSSLMEDRFAAKIRSLPNLSKPLNGQTAIFELTAGGKTQEIRFVPYSSTKQVMAKAFNEGCHSMEQYFYAVSGDLYLLNGTKKSVTLNINSVPGTVELIDDRPAEDSEYCSLVRRDHCVLLRMKN